jgi:ribosome-interacting GTPase 1
MFRHGWNLEELLETIWEYTKMIRIYTKVSRSLLYTK